MNVIVGLVMALGVFFFQPETAQANKPECPLSKPDASIPPTVVSRLCLPEPEQGSDGSPQAGAPEAQYHTVRPAETLIKIGKAYDTPVDVLMLANPHIANPDIIFIGDQLRIPSAAEIERLESEAARRRKAEQARIVASIPHHGERWIDVDLRTQTVRAYEGDTLVNTFAASTGTAAYPTVTGQFNIWIKLREDDMRGPGYNLKNVPYVMYFHKGYGLHGTYWHNNFGTPMSHGCVNLSTEDAAWLYDFSSTGTLVNVH